jgi:ribosomal protein S15P/S13E
MTEAKSREADDLPAECENASSPTPPEDIALLLAEIKALKEKDDSKGIVIRALQETVGDLLDREGEPGAVTEARIGELLNALTRGGNGPISLARFSFRGEGRLSRKQVYRLASHLKRDPRFKIGRTDLRYVPKARRRANFVWLSDRAPDWSRARF